MKKGPSGDTLRLSPRSELKGGPTSMLHAGLDLSRKKGRRLPTLRCGEHLDPLAAPPDADTLRRLARRIDEVHREPVCAVVESMTGADKIDSLVLATLSRRDLVRAIWLPDPRIREERELARFRSVPRWC
jgi:hypothetical protein